MGGRCATHDLAVGPDGRCVLCRRSLAPPPETIVIPRWAIAAVPLVVLVVVAIVLVARSTGGSPTAERGAERRLLEETPESAPPARDPFGEMPDREEPPRPPEAAEEEVAAAAVLAEKVAAASPPADPAVEAAQREAAVRDAMLVARRRVSITMYSTTWCPVCDRARAYLQQTGLLFGEQDVDSSDAAHRRMRALNPSGGVPTIAFDDEVIVGFRAERFEAALDRAARARALRMVGP